MTKILIKVCDWIMPSATVDLLGILKVWKREKVCREKKLFYLILFLLLRETINISRNLAFIS